MKTHINKLFILVIASLMITIFASKSYAFPLPATDMGRIGESIKQGMSMAKEIQQEVQSNMQIVKEIQHGGFGAAAGDLFAKVQNGDYDRFGNNMKNLGKQLGVQSKKDAQKAEEKEKAKEKASEEADDEAKEKLKKNEDAEAAALKVTEENIKKEKESKFKKAYNWVKNNKAATQAFTNTVKAVEKGDWGGAVSSAAGTAGAIGGGQVQATDKDGTQSGSTTGASK